MLCKEAVIEWKSIYEKQTGQEIGFEEATVRANRMFRLIKYITKPRGSNKLKSLRGGEAKNGKKTTSKKVRRN